ncbi:MAG TPA: GtrA family protein [Blastocatellia bacterium]|nr:GtrA family protein [Blastocatellia bacterium]
MSINRFFKFNAVGAAGIAVQALSLFFFMKIMGLHYLLATVLAVESALLHNFVWHRKWTWADRAGLSWSCMLARFNLTTGAICIIGNLFFMSIFVGRLGLNAYAANLAAIGICSLVNFMLADRYVFI